MSPLGKTEQKYLLSAEQRGENTKESGGWLEKDLRKKRVFRDAESVGRMD